MTSRVSALAVRQHLGEILDRVAARQHEYVVERKGRALAVLIPPQKAAAIDRAVRLHLLDMLDRAEPALSETEANRLTNTAKHETRRL